MSKDILRREIKERLTCTSKEEFHEQGISAAALLKSSAVWRREKSVFLFLSMESEIDTQPLLELAINEGKNVFVPKVVTLPQNDKLVFFMVSSPLDPWNKGPFGIKEPQSTKAAESGAFPALIIAPGLAFDREGNRLGRGKGFYDRFLEELDSEARRYFTIGLCMDFQIVSRVPSEENDKKMDGLLTGKELLILK